MTSAPAISPSVDAWEVELDRLELDVIRCERLMRSLDPSEIEAWQEPDLGPLPAHLLTRAQALHQRQLDVRAELAEALGANRRQHSYTARVVDSTFTPAAPAYLDLSV